VKATNGRACIEETNEGFEFGENDNNFKNTLEMRDYEPKK
jgi:hypothetical protein